MVTLTNPDLSDNGIGAKGAGAIAEALKVNTVLKSLQLYGNAIGPQGARAVAEALKVSSSLLVSGDLLCRR